MLVRWLNYRLTKNTLQGGSEGAPGKATFRPSNREGSHRGEGQQKGAPDAPLSNVGRILFLDCRCRWGYPKLPIRSSCGQVPGRPMS